MNVSNKAEQIAREAHKNHFRWDGKTPYIEHPKAVAREVQTDLLKATAWLHDVLEDTDVTAVDLLSQGIPEVVVIAVLAMTKLENENYLDYILRVKVNELAKLVKIVDITHNLSTLSEDIKARKDKYMLARYILNCYDPFIVEEIKEKYEKQRKT